ncbi:hypothetical protein V8E53_001477 [Lactarius tabidus]
MAVEASLAEDEYRLEPPRPPINETINPNHVEDLPQTPHRAFQLRGGHEGPLTNEPFVVKFPGMAGSYTINGNADTGIDTDQDQASPDGTNNCFAPFSSQREWEIAWWAKLRGPSSTAFSELMNIKGVTNALGLPFKDTRELNGIIDKSLAGRPHFQRHVVTVGSEVCEVYYRDIIECIKSLFADPTFTPYLHLAPEKHYTDDTKDTWMYHDMHTGKWWWATQQALEQERPGATIIPVLLSTDKTLLTTFRNKSAYPLYMTIGNIPKEIRRKPSMHAYILLGYLPTTCLSHVSNQAQRRRLLANLYHLCMHQILAPLNTAGTTGVHMMCGNGRLYQNHPIFAVFIGDYPEQILSTGSITGRCPTCDVDHDLLGDYDLRDSNHLWDLASILTIYDSFEQDPADFLRACSSAGIKPIVHPFWKDFPYAHIFRSITPDILHQIYQGIVKHITKWITKAVGAAEVDARCCRLPPNHNLHPFTKGISKLSRITGQEHSQIGRILLALVMDVPLPEGRSNARLVRATRALMDFVYIAQYPVHMDKTLELLEDAFSQFHENKSIFLNLGIRFHFNIPKFHFTTHYVELIKLYGTTDNFNTEATERLHIDIAKDGYGTTNHKDKFFQMTIWLEQKEKIHQHERLVKWWLDGSPPVAMAPQEWLPPGLELDHDLHISKFPSIQSLSLETIETEYGAEHFRTALRCYVVRSNSPDLTTAQVEHSLWDVNLPFQHLPVWHRIKYLRTEIYTGQTQTVDSIHAYPDKTDKHGRPVPGRFDTAFINDRNGGDTGVNGYRIGHVHIVFSLPKRSLQSLFRMGADGVPKHLVYVEWYTAFTQDPDPNSLLYKISPMRDRDGGRVCSIIPLANIRRSVHLIPKFGAVAPQEWRSSTVLDMANVFYVNSFTDNHLYCIMC